MVLSANLACKDALAFSLANFKYFALSALTEVKKWISFEQCFFTASVMTSGSSILSSKIISFGYIDALLSDR